MSAVSERTNRSVIPLLTPFTITAFPFSSVMASGDAKMPCKVQVDIWISGKARPIMSPSTNGNPSALAAQNGMVEFRPPASADTSAVARRPKKVCSASITDNTCSRLAIFSISTVGAPTPATANTNASSASVAASIKCTGPLACITFCANSLPR